MKIPELNIGGKEVSASEMKKVSEYYDRQLIMQKILSKYDVADEEEAYLCAEAVLESVEDGYCSLNVAMDDIMSGFGEHQWQEDVYDIPDYVNGKISFSAEEMEEINGYIKPYIIVEKVKETRKSLTEEELFCIADRVISLMEAGDVSEDEAINMAVGEYTADSGNNEDDYYKEDEFELVKTIEELEDEEWD